MMELNRAGILTASLVCGWLVAGAGVANADKPGDPRGQSHSVNCDQGGSIERALRKVRPGDHISISGHCQEHVLITIDGVTLAGKNGAVIDGGGAGAPIAQEGVVTVAGARGVTLRDLRVSNGPDIGIVARDGASVHLQRVVAENHTTTGIVLDNSRARMHEVTASNNGLAGIDAFTHSTVIAQGAIETRDNGAGGVEINGASFLELRGAILTSSDNRGDGLLLVGGSVLQIFSFPEAQGSGVVSRGNHGNGILLATSEIVVVGSQFTGSGANLFDISLNDTGIFMPSGAINNPFGTARFDVHHNGVGVLAVDGANILSIGGFVVRDNDVGLVGDAAGNFTLVSVPPNPSALYDNGLDISLAFGTRLTVNGARIDSLQCDQTVLSRGTTVCP